jgi:hypothetical protein
MAIAVPLVVRPRAHRPVPLIIVIVRAAQDFVICAFSKGILGQMAR